MTFGGKSKIRMSLEIRFISQKSFGSLTMGKKLKIIIENHA